MSMSYRYGDDPYYVHPEYEAGKRDRDDALSELANYLTGVIDELGCRLPEDDEEGRALALAALAKAQEVL